MRPDRGISREVYRNVPTLNQPRAPQPLAKINPVATARVPGRETRESNPSICHCLPPIELEDGATEGSNQQRSHTRGEDFDVGKTRNNLLQGRLLQMIPVIVRNQDYADRWKISNFACWWSDTWCDTRNRRSVIAEQRISDYENTLDFYEAS
jgi:hypothetical protein